jgi:hypothetical protein
MRCSFPFVLHKGTEDPSEAIFKPKCGNFYYQQTSFAVYIYIGKWIQLTSTSTGSSPPAKPPSPFPSTLSIQASNKTGTYTYNSSTRVINYTLAITNHSQYPAFVENIVITISGVPETFNQNPSIDVLPYGTYYLNPNFAASISAQPFQDP